MPQASWNVWKVPENDAKTQTSKTLHFCVLVNSTVLTSPYNEPAYHCNV